MGKSWAMSTAIFLAVIGLSVSGALVLRDDVTGPVGWLLLAMALVGLHVWRRAVEENPLSEEMIHRRVWMQLEPARTTIRETPMNRDGRKALALSAACQLADDVAWTMGKNPMTDAEEIGSEIAAALKRMPMAD